MDNNEIFCKIIQKYNPVDLYALLVFYKPNTTNDFENDVYDGSINLFAKIISLSNLRIRTKKINFYNDAHCKKLFLIMWTFLSKKYQSDLKELRKCVEEDIITCNQFSFELASPKTYPRIFAENIEAKLMPFNNILKQRYNIDSHFISQACESICKNAIKYCSKDDIISHSCTNIIKCFPSDFLDDLISVNEKSNEPLAINSFSKTVCIPIVKTNGEYNIISFDVFIDNFYIAVHRLCLLHMNKTEKDRLSNIKGQNFNDYCKDVFENVFLFDNVYSNFKYSKNENNGEIDLLISNKDVLLVIECKARNYTDKISGLHSSFTKANESNLDFSSFQIRKFLNLLDKNNEVSIFNGEERFQIIKSKYNYIIPIVINLANLAELNSDYSKRDIETLFISYDDLKIISDIIQKRKWLFIDFVLQFLDIAKHNSMIDDIIDAFAFYCCHKNLSILRQDKMAVCIYQLGNGFFQKYFTYYHDINPISIFENDIKVFDGNLYTTYKEMISAYHKTYWMESLEEICK